MAKVTGPILSLHARGSIARALTFREMKSGTHVRQYKRPKKREDPRTNAQQFSRSYFAVIVSIWHASDPAFRAEWNDAAKGYNMSGFNLFLSQYSMIRPTFCGHFILGYSQLGGLTV